MIYAQRHNPESVRCETVQSGEVCGEPADYTRSRRFRDAGHTWWRHHPICESCAHLVRRAEIDWWLQEIGARVIRVKDLGAAMEAHYIGGRTAILAQNTHAGGEGLRSFLCSVVNEQAQSAAHLARLALGHTD